MDIQHEQEGGEHTALRRVPLLSTTVQIVWLPHLKCLWSVCEEVLSEKPYSSYFSILPVIPEQSFSLICIAVFMLYDMFVQKLKALLWMWPISVSNMPLRDSQSLPVRSSFISVMKNACSCEETLMDGVNHYSLRHYSWLDSIQGNLLSYHVCETRPVSRIMAEPILQRQSHSIEIKSQWKSCSWETSPERLSDASNYSSANTPAHLQLL